jgi:hypothetical protein
MLSGFKHSHANVDVSSWDGEVDDDLYGGVGQQVVDGSGRQTELRSACFRGFLADIRSAFDVENRKVRGGPEIRFADIAASNNSDTHSVHVHFLL